MLEIKLSCHVSKCKCPLVFLCLLIIEEIHMKWGERPTFLMIEVLHRQLLIKSLSTAVYYTQSHDHEAHCGNTKPQDSYCSFGHQSRREDLMKRGNKNQVKHFNNIILTFIVNFLYYMEVQGKSIIFVTICFP